MTGGRETALKAFKALCVGVPRVDRLQDFAKLALAPRPQVTSKLRAGTVEAIERILWAKFARPHLLAQALVRTDFRYANRANQPARRHTRLFRGMR